ncbi:MAG: type II toxin-antitoxin system prevent-host-death family antitoxin [Pirellulales bacterium]|nr:type II toxin-antitoxin system prevent-host-death family antitoxin [Pirellulales bacterium]
MIEVGTFEAKTHLTQLLERVAKGDRIVITRRGKPVAMLVPPEVEQETDVAAVVRAMLAQRDQQGPKLGRGVSVRQLIEEGRRY